MRARLLVSLALAAGCGRGGAGALVVDADSGEPVLSVRAEVAETAEAREQGWRGADPPGAGEGLLLVMPREVEVCIQNDGVDFAIDAVYAGGGGAVLAVERSIPAGDPTGRCHPARWVLEVAAGEARDVAPGDDFVLH